MKGNGKTISEMELVLSSIRTETHTRDSSRMANLMVEASITGGTMKSTKVNGSKEQKQDTVSGEASMKKVTLAPGKITEQMAMGHTLGRTATNMKESGLTPSGTAMEQTFSGMVMNTLENIALESQMVRANISGAMATST